MTAEELSVVVGAAATIWATQVPVTRDDGSIAWFARHHSLDGREAKETK